MTNSRTLIDFDGQTLSLPVEALRPHQEDAIRQVLTGFESYDVVFLDAPTGAGKTIIGDAVRQLLANRGLYVCTTKTLQDQVERDFEDAVVIKGRDNYRTLDNPDAFDLSLSRRISTAHCTRSRMESYEYPACDTCEFAVPDRDNDPTEDQFRHCFHCHPVQDCPYDVAKLKASRARFAVANTAYFLTEANYVGLFSGSFPLVVVDEADTLESVLMSFIDLRLSLRALKKYNLPLKPEFVTKPESWIDWCHEAEDIMSTVIGRLPQPNAMDADGKVKREIEEAASTLAQISYVRTQIESDPEGWVLDRDEGLSLKPVEVGAKARARLWNHAPSWLLMSATMISPHQVAADLGLQDEEWTSVRVDSNFPIERRPIIVRPTASVTHKTKDEAYPAIAKAIAQILDTHLGERVLVHTVSYKLTESVQSTLTAMGYGSRLVTYDQASDREDALARYKRRIDSVLLAPSLDRGVDLPDDLCRVIVIAKVPFPNLGDPVVKKRFYSSATGKRWYSTQTVRSLVQMTGRGMRHANDQVTTYILDDQFRLNVWRNMSSRNLIPKWWSSALRWETPSA